MTKNGEISFRIRLKAYNSRVLRISSLLLEKELAKLDQIYSGQTVLRGPIRLPVKKRYYSLLRSPHIDKDSQEQFEIRRHKWIFDIHVPKKNYINLLSSISFPPGVDVSIFFNQLT
uniref:Ribosomal protein S10 n=1 Tax=Characiopsis acuta TaxID=2040456 RepID=A0A3R5QQR9_9STRA|nr:ribosomal protein S10 [Characiopsis acuta]QAA11237.1 ribosomal protein S10 [Characiopsis acuta]